MKKIILPVLFVVFVLASMASPVLAQDCTDFSMNGLLTCVAGGSGWNISGADNPGKALSQAVGSIIMAFLSLLGVIFLILMVWGGYTWMLARGNEEKVEKAREIIADAILGIMVILFSALITWFIISRVGGHYE